MGAEDGRAAGPLRSALSSSGLGLIHGPSIGISPSSQDRADAGCDLTPFVTMHWPAYQAPASTCLQP